MFLVMLTPILMFFAITKRHNNISYNSPFATILIIAICLFFMFIGYKYFLSNRARRNKIIDEYRYLPKYKKYAWMIFSLLMFFGPLFYILFM